MSDYLRLIGSRFIVDRGVDTDGIHGRRDVFCVTGHKLVKNGDSHELHEVIELIRTEHYQVEEKL
jgi:hypothetical protein